MPGGRRPPAAAAPTTSSASRARGGAEVTEVAEAARLRAPQAPMAKAAARCPWTGGALLLHACVRIMSFHTLAAAA